MPDSGYIYAKPGEVIDIREPWISPAVTETNKIFKEIRREVLQNKLIDRVILRKMSKKMFNKRRPEWLSDFQMAKVIMACIEIQEQKNAKGEQCKVTSKSSPR